MRLTTRLMQVASWLLVQRAVREGELDPREACQPRYRIGAEAVCRADSTGTDDLPGGLVSLLSQSERLYERVMHLDRRMFVEGQAEETPNPVLSQLEKLQAAFSAA
jgi:regulator of CtrA degradation